MQKPINTALFILISCILYGQEYPCVNYTTQDGLPTNVLWNIAQDTNDIMFFGSAEGLVRYDGKHFELFDDFSSIDLNASHLKVDELNQIWFVNFTNELFYYHEGKVNQLRLYSADSLELKVGINDIEDHGSSIQVIARDDEKSYLYVELDIKTKKIINYHYREIKGDPLRKIRENKKYTLKYVSNDILTLKLFEKDSEQVLKLIRQYTLIKKPVNYCYHYDEDEIFCIVLNVDNKWYLYTVNANTLSLIEIEDESISRLNTICAYQDYYLIGTGVGLLIAGKDGEIRNHLYKEYEIADVFVDNKDDVWITTPTNGVFRIQNTNMRIYKDNHPTYAIANNKLYNKKLYSNQPKNNNYINQTKNELSISSNEDHFFYSKGRKVVLNKMYTNASKWATFDEHENLLIANHEGLAVFYKEPTNDGDLYYERLESESEKFHSGSHQLRLIYSTKIIETGDYFLKYDYDVYKMKYIIMDGENLYYHSHSSGYIYHFDGTTLERYDFKGRISSIFVVEGILHIATKNDGVFILKNDKIIADQRINFFLKERKIKRASFESEFYWILDKNTLIKVPKEKNTASYFDYRSGLNQQEFKDFVITDDTIYLAIEEGILTMPIDFEFTQNLNLKPKLDWIKKRSEYITKNQLANLNYNDKDIVVKVTTNEYRDQNSIVLEYRVKGLNNSWIKIRENSIYLNQLTPGNYTLEVRSTIDGYTGGETLKIPLRVNSPWYFLWWVIIIYILILLGAVLLFINWRLSIVRKKNEIEFYLIQLKQQALQAQMNPHFIFNTLNAVQRFMLENEQENALRYLSKISHLIRKVFEFNNQQFISVSDEVTFLKLYLELEERRFHPNVKVTFKKEKLQDLNQKLKIPALIIQPIIENAFKHGLKQDGNDQIIIDFSYSENILSVIVSDSGKGFDDAHNKKSRTGSLKLNIERLSLFSQKGYKTGINVNNRYNKKQETIGAQVLINIPLLNEN